MEVQVNIDCADADALADFYCAALGYRRFGSAGQYRSIVPEAGTDGPKLIFQQVDEPKAVKNRVHLDLATTSAAHQADLVARLQDLGATPADVGQGDVSWTVLADPEGNEFDVLTPR